MEFSSALHRTGRADRPLSVSDHSVGAAVHHAVYMALIWAAGSIIVNLLKIAERRDEREAQGRR